MFRLFLLQLGLFWLLFRLFGLVLRLFWQTLKDYRMTDSNEIATPSNPTNFQNSNSLVQIQTKIKISIWICSAKYWAIWVVWLWGFRGYTILSWLCHRERVYTATHCNALQRTAAPCNALQHTATHCNTLLHTARHCNILQHTATHCNTLRHIIGGGVPRLQHIATHCSIL